MRAGELRCLFALERPTSALGWEQVARLWAACEPMVGRETFGLTGIDTALAWRIRTRYRAGVLPTMRLRAGTRQYRILSVAPDPRHRELVLLAEEILA